MPSHSSPGSTFKIYAWTIIGLQALLFIVVYLVARNQGYNPIWFLLLLIPLAFRWNWSPAATRGMSSYLIKLKR